MSSSTTSTSSTSTAPKTDKSETPDSSSSTTQTKEQVELDNLIKRVLYYKNPFDVLDLPASATVEEIQKKYKKLALVLHPDKCKHPRGQDAFSSLKRANTILQEEAIRKRYGEIMEQVRSEVIDEQGTLPLETRKKGAMLEYEIKLRTHKKLLELEDYNKNADKYRTVNERREKEDEDKRRREDVERSTKEKEWEEGRETRVESWRQFVTKKPDDKSKANPNRPPPLVPDDKKRKATGPLKPPKLKTQR